MRSTNRGSFIPSLAILALALGVHADPGALRYEPGRWRTTTTMRTPMLPAPQVRTSVECIQAGEYSAERLMRDQQGCRVQEPVVTARAMRWTATCAAGDGSATGRGEFEVSEDGTRGRGTVTIDVASGGQKMTMTMEVESERIGDCD